MGQFDTFTVRDWIRKYKPKLEVKQMQVYMDLKNLTMFNYLHSKVSEYWQKNRKMKSELNDIFFHKVISQVIEDVPCLDFITRGWYLYGVLIVEPRVGQERGVPTIKDMMNHTGLNHEQIEQTDTQIIKRGDEYDCNQNQYVWESKQYKNFNNKVYSRKLELQNALKNKNYAEADRKLSDLSLALNLELHNFNPDVGCQLLLRFIETAKMVIISHKGNIPRPTSFNEAFKKSWTCFARINLGLSAKGGYADTIRYSLLNPEEISSFCFAAEKANRELRRDIKLDGLNFTIEPTPIQEEYLRLVNEL